jgi:hypothetical protein
MSEESDYYMRMINALSGLIDDMDANGAPQDAKSKLRDVIRICLSDYKSRFGKGD